MRTAGEDRVQDAQACVDGPVWMAPGQLRPVHQGGSDGHPGRHGPENVRPPLERNSMTTPHTTDAEIVEALRAVAEHGSRRKAANALGLHPSTLNKRVIMGEQRGLSAESAVLDEKAKLRIELAQARRDLTAAQKEADTAERIRTEIYNLASRSPAPPKWLAPPRSTEDHRGMPMTIWSDW